MIYCTLKCFSATFHQENLKNVHCYVQSGFGSSLFCEDIFPRYSYAFCLLREQNFFFPSASFHKKNINNSIAPKTFFKKVKVRKFFSEGSYFFDFRKYLSRTIYLSKLYKMWYYVKKCMCLNGKVFVRWLKYDVEFLMYGAFH